MWSSAHCCCLASAVGRIACRMSSLSSLGRLAARRSTVGRAARSVSTQPVLCATKQALSEEDRELVRSSIRVWAETEIAPHIAEWDEAETFPRDLYRQAGEIGLLGAGYPSEFGGTPMPLSLACHVWEDLSRISGSGGLCASLGSHGIAIPPILAMGSPELQQRIVPSVLRGESIAALGITEPSAGSDVANIKTTAVRDGDEYVVNGSKIFITSGMRADFYTVAVRTSTGSGNPYGELSLLVIDKGTPGFTQTQLKKQGWWCSDTAALYFDDVRVPAANLVGKEGAGFKGIVYNFNQERIWLAVQALGLARACYAEALAWAKERHTFGRPLTTRQVIRHKLVDMYGAIEATAAMLDSVVTEVEAGGSPVAKICVLKNQAVDCVQFVSDQGLQILGGSGFMRGGVCERVYREVKVLAIGGGSTEIMKDLAARQLQL